MDSLCVWILAVNLTNIHDQIFIQWLSDLSPIVVNLDVQSHGHI